MSGWSAMWTRMGETYRVSNSGGPAHDPRYAGWMGQALAVARGALASGDVPVGAVGLSAGGGGRDPGGCRGPGHLAPGGLHARRHPRAVRDVRRGADAGPGRASRARRL